MSIIKSTIEELNSRNEKVLSVFLTAGFPTVNKYVDIMSGIIESGGDIIEVGIPFSDPLADGSIIQKSSHIALENGVTLKEVFYFTEAIRKKYRTPIILMGYANPILRYGLESFFADAKNSGADGVIIPDVPLEEYDSFFPDDKKNLDVIMLSTPASGEDRLKLIDEKSEGFVYCVSVLGTTGMRKEFSEEQLIVLQNTRKKIVNNKMMVGFGISSEANVRQVAPYCDGVIVGSVVVKSLMDSGDDDLKKTYRLVADLKAGTLNN